MAQSEITDNLFNEQEKKEAEELAQFRVPVACWPLLILFAVLTIIVFSQFFSRYVLNNSLAWTEEAARYLLILLTFWGMILVQIRGTDIVLEFLDRRWGRMLPTIKIFARLCGLCFLIFLAFSANTLIERTSFQSMISLPFPKYYLHICVLGAVLINIVVHAVQIFHLVWWNNFRKEG